VRLADVLQKLGKDICLVNRPEMGHDTSYDDTRQILEFVIDKAHKDTSSTSSKPPAVTAPK
jgi:hypothetical protein